MAYAFPYSIMFQFKLPYKTYYIPGGGDLYFKVDIIRVKRLSKSTLNMYFSKCENIP